MITENYMTIVEEVRSHKEAVAAKHEFDVARIVAAARLRQESSGRRIIRQPATPSESDAEGGDKPQPDSEGRSRAPIL